MQLVEYFYDMKMMNFEAKLLYRASRDGFKAADFHRTSINKGPTISIIQTTTGHIIGGYTGVSWGDCGDFKSDKTAWIYSFSHREPFKITKSRQAIACFSNSGPVFGNGDIVIKDESDESFVHWNEYSGYDFRGKHLMDGSGRVQFNASQIEVYSVAFKL
ncbi:hypothetical protein FGO68_gene2395 [Halteria grandinella]|uniref:TLDc domain-containing protein n=1 Tax=Halteria grandinella TaxID=5974 RepID=A0A8J8T2U5_HALGN|nr:hypothetical protein FGO68_gene2395 [Halteria grandinella]